MTRVNVDRWRAHVMALRESGLTVAQYAEQHGVSRHTLYAARRQMAAETAKRAPAAKRMSAPRASSAAFVAVRVLGTPLSLRAQLRNGVTLEFSKRSIDPIIAQ